MTREVERHAAGAGTNITRLLSPVEDWLLWRECAAEAIGELDLVNPGALAESLRRASALATEFGIDVVRLRDAPGTEPELLREVQRVVNDRCQALGAATVASLIEQLPQVGDARPVSFSGFLELTPRLKKIGAGRDGRGYVTLGGRAAGANSSTAEGGVRPRVVIAGDELEELERIAEWCRAQLASRPDARLLVVLPGPLGARDQLATLIRQAVDPRGWLAEASGAEALVVIEGGTPLARVPAIAHALATLTWLDGATGDFEAVSEWLRSPYWNTPALAARVRLDLWLRERGRMHFALRELAVVLSTAPSGVADAAREITRRITSARAALAPAAAPGSGSPREWSERFRAALAAFDWPGNRTRSSGEQQTVVRFHELLDEFGQLASAARSMSRDSAIRWFTELATHTAFRPADDDAVVTISPMLADPIVHYDGVWVAGLHGEVFPQPVQPDPFVPLAAQIAAGVPTASAAGRLEEAQTLITAWRAIAGELVLSAPARAEDLELLPSPLLGEWIESARPGMAVPARRKRPASRTSASDHAPSHAAPTPVWLPARMHRDGLLESLEDVVGIAWPTARPLPSGTRSLELQNQCPFRAYAELRLGSGELELPEPGVAPDLRGQLLHAALQRLWSGLGDSQALLAHSEGTLGALIDQCVQEAAEATLGRLRGSDAASAEPANRQPAFARECRRASRLIRTLCALERERGPFRVEATELESTLVIRDARLRMRIDRLDTLESGGRAILDYKSGRRTTADWYSERPSHPQLLAYLASVGSDVVAMATVNITAREVRFDGVASSPELLPKVKGVEGPEGQTDEDAWRSRQQQWLTTVERLADDFVAGRATVDPKPGACDYCHATSICRIADRRGDPGESPDSDANGLSLEAGHE